MSSDVGSSPTMLPIFSALPELLGGTVGYQIRFDRRASSRTKILVMTEGILTRRFVSDPFLDGVSVVVLDEFHERSVHSDLALAFCRELALNEQGRLLATLPVHPRLGAILARAARLGRRSLGAAEAAAASEQDIRRAAADIDFDSRVEALLAFEQGGGLEYVSKSLGLFHGRARFALNAKSALERAVRTIPEKVSSMSGATAGRLLIAGYPDRVGRIRKGTQRDAVMVGGRGARLRSDWGDASTDLFVALEAHAGKRGDRAVSTVFSAAAVSREDLEAAHPALLSTRQTLGFDKSGEVVTARQETVFIDLVIDERPSAEMDSDAVAAFLAEAAVAHWDEVFLPDRAASELLSRIRFASKVLPDTALPDVSHEGLQTMLTELCFGKRSLTELRRIDWGRVLRERLDYTSQRCLDEQIPERLETPAGKSYRLDYTSAIKGDTPGPVLACPIQVLFGLTETPRIAEGRVPVTLHLLAPNGRPCQVTQDLRSFWERTYGEVLKELKGRYPKHYWPEDPFSAHPTSRVRPR